MIKMEVDMSKFKLKRYIVMVLILIFIMVIVLFGFTGCNTEIEEETPNIYVSLRNSTTGNIQSLTWIVENRSKVSTFMLS